jgi:hypothetical protein
LRRSFTTAITLAWLRTTNSLRPWRSSPSPFVTGSSSAISFEAPVAAPIANSWPETDFTEISVFPPRAASMPLALNAFGVYVNSPVIGIRCRSPSAAWSPNGMKYSCGTLGSVK